jgi:hypothetical protein
MVPPDANDPGARGGDATAPQTQPDPSTATTVPGTAAAVEPGPQPEPSPLPPRSAASSPTSLTDTIIANPEKAPVLPFFTARVLDVQSPKLLDELLGQVLAGAPAPLTDADRKRIASFVRVAADLCRRHPPGAARVHFYEVNGRRQVNVDHESNVATATVVLDPIDADVEALFPARTASAPAAAAAVARPPRAAQTAPAAPSPAPVKVNPSKEASPLSMAPRGPRGVGTTPKG